MALPVNREMGDLFEELRIRLYELGEGRDCFLLTPASEPRLASISYGLKTTDVVIELLRYKWHYLTSNEGQGWSLGLDNWQARRDKLLQEVRKPWDLCTSNPGNTKCPGGSLGCEACRYSILSIANQINVLALGSSGMSFLQKEDHGKTYGTDAKSKDDIEDIRRKPGSSRPDKNSVQQEELTRRDSTTEKAEVNVNDSTTSSLDKEREKYAKMKGKFDSMAEMVKRCVESLIPYRETPGAVADVLAKLCEAFSNRLTFQLESLEMDDMEEEDLVGRRKDLELEKLKYDHKRVRALIQLDKNTVAEPIAQRVLQRRHGILGYAHADTQDILKDYCEILLQVGKANVAEFEYLKIWNDATLSSDEAKDGAGLGLARLMEQQNDNEQAAIWYRNVAARQLERGYVSLGAQSALKMLSTCKSRSLSDKSLELLEKIWSAGQLGSGIRVDSAVLSCGQALGRYLISIGKCDKAKSVFVALWKALEKDQLEKQLVAASSLASIIPLLANIDDSEIQIVYQDILDRSQFSKDKKRELKFQHLLGCIQLSRKNYDDAKRRLETTWNDAKSNVGQNDIYTIQYGYDYGRAILVSGGLRGRAKKVFEELWATLKDPAPTVAVLTTGRFYGELLLETAASHTNEDQQKAEYQKATNALARAWDVGWPQKEKLFTEREISAIMDLLLVGDMYGDCLTYIGSYQEAIRVLNHVLELKRIWNSDFNELSITQELLKEAQDMMKPTDNTLSAGNKLYAIKPGGTGSQGTAKPSKLPVRQPKSLQLQKQSRSIEWSTYFACRQVYEGPRPNVARPKVDNESLAE